jgi:hypothetical protein
MRVATVLLDFLHENGLLMRELHQPGATPPRDLCLMQSDLTTEGNAVMRLALLKWLAAHDRGKDIEDVTRLQLALQQVRSGAKR